LNELQAAQIRFRAERRLGELLIKAKEIGQVRGGQPVCKSSVSRISRASTSRIHCRPNPSAVVG
jgi:hypothetical protein